ncbi:MAG: PAS domain S-box protein [Phycisphaerales bacterium]|nr:PAS domain S-box protein [Phycisphaerales bacterium]
MAARLRKLPGAASAAVPAASGGVRDLILDPIITMNEGGIIQSASDSVERVFGWTPSELFGRSVKVLIPEPRRSALDRYLDRYRHADKPRVAERARRFDAVRKDGKLLQIELSMSRADLPANAGLFFIGIIRDVSNEIDVNVSTADERTRLQHLITEQTRALATANLRLHLADRLASLGTLAAGLGHDMSNVLLPVRARLNALERGGMTTAALRHVTAVRRSIVYLQHLSDALHFLALDPDAVGDGGESDGEGTTELARWWRQVGPLLRKAVPKHVKVQASFPAGLPIVKIGPHWLTQAVLNLIVNAGEAIPEGRREGRVRITAKPVDGGRSVRLGITDNGRGMGSRVQRRAFDLFFTTKSRSMGTGLGLPLARKVALRAGGDIVLTSEPGAGTTVELILPTTKSGSAKAARRAPGDRTAAVSVGNHRTAALISQILIANGYRVKPASGEAPGRASLWVTKPTPKALDAAPRWRKGHPERAVVLLGAPPKHARAKWATIGATVIDSPADFEAIRLALGHAAEGGDHGG